MFDGDRSNCPGKHHGTRSAYLNHGCICQDAKVANFRYFKAQRAGILKPALISIIPTKRKIDALHAVGHSNAVISKVSGLPEFRILKLSKGRRKLVRQSEADAITAAYILLADQPGDSVYAMNAVSHLGCFPPSAWIDIDDLEEVPVPLPEPDDDYVDPVLMERALRWGDRAAVAELCQTRAGKDAFVESYLMSGGTITALTRALNCSGTSVRSLVKRMLGRQLDRLIQQRQAAGEDWSDLFAVMVAAGAGYLTWDEQATRRRIRNYTLLPHSFNDDQLADAA